MGKRDELSDKIKALLTSAREITVEAEKAERDFTADERQKVQAYIEEAARLKEQLKAVDNDEALKEQIEVMGEGLERREAVLPARAKRGTIGERFVNNPQFQAWLKQVAPGGVIPESVKGLQSPPVEFGSFIGRKDLITGASDTSAGAFVQTDYTGIYEPIGRYDLPLRGLISVRTTTSDLVEYVRQTAQVTQAAPVPESNVTVYSGSTGEVKGNKPEATMTWEKVTATVKTIAVWIPATKRALSDASQLRGLIDQELRDDLAEELEYQILNGNGVGENFTGILNTAGVLTQAWDADLLTTTRRAKTNLLVNGRAQPTAWLINPEDWETVELLRDDDGRHYWGGPIMDGQRRLWGVPVVECQSIPQGTALLGDFRKAVLWDRERASISVSDSHADFFIRNMVAILAEMRAAFGVIRPTAFVVVDVSSGT